MFEYNMITKDLGQSKEYFITIDNNFQKNE